jgi:hypothetical protein
MVDYIRANLKPKGTAEIVRIEVNNPYYNMEFINKMTAHLEKVVPLARAGICELSPTGVFALEILGDSCYFSKDLI